MTEIIIRPRLCGKTTELIRRSAETGCCIVCTDMRRARQIAERAGDLALDIPFPLTAGEWVKHSYYSRGVRGLLFDDLDAIIASLSTVPVLAATWTADEP